MMNLSNVPEKITIGDNQFKYVMNIQGSEMINKIKIELARLDVVEYSEQKLLEGLLHEYKDAIKKLERTDLFLLETSQHEDEDYITITKDMYVYSLEEAI